MYRPSFDERDADNYRDSTVQWRTKDFVKGVVTHENM